MILLNILLLIIGFAMLVKGADWFVDGAAGIAGKLKIPQLVIGLTIVAMGTSAPEAAVSITASLKGNSGIAIGNVVGSNILNILLILGVTTLIVNVAIQKSTLMVEIPYMVVITLLLMGMGMTGGQVSRAEGGILWVLFIVYLGYMFYLTKNKKDEEAEEKRSAWKLLLFMVLGIVLIVTGSNFTVDGATEIARAIGISERFIGLTIVAFGTSLPELVTSVTAAGKGNADIAVGNIVGSNIFNVLFILGTTAVITPIPYEAAFLIDGGVAVVAGIVLWIAVFRKLELRRVWGIIMLGLYAVYFTYLLLI